MTLLSFLAANPHSVFLYKGSHYSGHHLSKAFTKEPIYAGCETILKGNEIYTISFDKHRNIAMAEYFTGVSISTFYKEKKVKNEI